ncbi:hypothetical protein LTSEMIN_4262, partial [Salmonella enterica subsp. enterica serovar Minnesota str. A4-603]
ANGKPVASVVQLNCLYNTGALRQAFALNHRSIQSVEIQP